MGKLRAIQINPIPVIVVAVLIAVALGYFFLIRPGQVNKQIEKDWITPEAAYARHDGRKKDPTRQEIVDQLRAKEGANPAAHRVRRRDRE